MGERSGTRNPLDIFRRPRIRNTTVALMAGLALAGCGPVSAAPVERPSVSASANPGEGNQSDDKTNEDHENAEHQEDVDHGDQDDTNHEKIKVNYEDFKDWYNKPGELTIDHPLSSFEGRTSPKFRKSQRNIAQDLMKANGVEMNIDTNGVELTAGGEYLTKDPAAFVNKKTSELRIIYLLAKDSSDPRNIEIAKMLIPYITQKDSPAREQVIDDINMIEQGGEDQVPIYTYAGPREGDVFTRAKVESQGDVGAMVATVNLTDQHDKNVRGSIKFDLSGSGNFRIAEFRGLAA